MSSTRELENISLVFGLSVLFKSGLVVNTFKRTRAKYVQQTCLQ